MGNVKNLTDSDFDTTISGAKLPLLIDFSATWCGPCKALAPLIDSVAGDYKGRLEVYKVDIDEAEGEVDPDDNLMDYGLDSVQVMALVAEWRTLGLDVNFADLAKTPTLNAWWDLLARRQAA